MSYKDLADRVCAASPEALGMVMREVGRVIFKLDDYRRLSFNQLLDAGAYLDAAAAIVPEGYLFVVVNGNTKKLEPNTDGATALVGPPDNVGTETKAPTPAQALTAAALLAREER